jgi:hypothetical protein
VLGNPPFIGKKEQTPQQKADFEPVMNCINGFGVLDFVAAWYIKSAQYLRSVEPQDGPRVAFVSTNSITQGEQVGVLWAWMLAQGIYIQFAHRTFSWSNEAKGNAAVYCVIVGFANFDINDKRIFDYEDIKGEAHEIKAKNINPYLIDAKDIFITKRTNAICKVPKIKFGNQPIDGGWLILDEEETAVMEALTKNDNPKISLEFNAAVGDSFGVKIVWRDVSITENFRL